MRYLGDPAFNLAELLIVLAILGVIATFTIPKILSSQQNGQKMTAAKEVAGMIAAAFQQHRLNGLVNANTNPNDLTQYNMNYVSVDTTTSNAIDWTPTLGAVSCNNTEPCLRLHNGGILVPLHISATFGGTSPNNVIEYVFDPDGSYSGSTSGSGKAVQFELYYSGRVGSRAELFNNAADVVYNPSWWQW